MTLQSRRLSSFAALTLLAACAPRSTKESKGEVERTFTPTTYTVADLYKNTRFRGASWSPDLKKILVSSNQSGIWNAYIVPSGGQPQPLTQSTTNSIFAISYFPADERILYSSDEGGNELTHIYVRLPDGTAKDLTPGAKLKANFLGWADDDKSFFISTNERDPRYFDVYEIATDGYARTLLYKNTEGYDVNGVISRDKRYLALGKPRTTSDADIYLYDRQSNSTKNITQHTGTVNNSPADFAPDGTKLLFVSDSGGEFASLRSYDLATGAKATVYEEKWDILTADYSKGGKYLTVVLNEDSRPTTRVLDATTFAPVALRGMPEGLVRGVTIARNDSALAFYASDGSVPDELFAGKIGAAPIRLTNALDPAIKREDLVVPKVVRFKSYDGVEVPGVLYKPHQASSSAKAPAIVLVHGGPGGQAQIGYGALTQALVNHGYAVFDINNRGSSGYGKTFYAMDDRKHGEADLGDVVASRKMLTETGWVDSTRIGIIGGSYGGYMVLAALTLQPDAFKVGVDLFGISNWMRTLESIPPWWASFREALYQEMGDPKADSARLRRISPLFNADKIKVPLMVLQGANDPRVLKVESDEIVAAAKKNGVPVEYIVFPDEGHGFVKKENEIRGYAAVIAFLDKHLKGEGRPVAN
jgi:dipeptidyl aminopeptidase/acylaminoacyl peptidase